MAASLPSFALVLCSLVVAVGGESIRPSSFGLVLWSLVVAVGGESIRPSSYGLAYGYWHHYSMANGSTGTARCEWHFDDDEHGSVDMEGVDQLFPPTNASAAALGNVTKVFTSAWHGNATAWHRNPAPQLVYTNAGYANFTTDDGTTITTVTMGPGDVYLGEDQRTARGHRTTRVRDGAAWLATFVQFGHHAPTVDAPCWLR